MISVLLNQAHIRAALSTAVMPVFFGFINVVGERFGIDVSQSSGRTIGELASVRELSFAFRRAASRLMEMCSKNRWDVVLSHKG